MAITNILEILWNKPYFVYAQLRDPIIIILVLYFTIIGWNERRLVNRQSRNKTITLLVFYFAIIGVGSIIYNWIFDLDLNIFAIGLVPIGVAYGLWNLQKWAGILGIFLTIETVIINIYIDTFGSEFWYGSILKYSWDVVIIVLIILNLNNLTPKSLMEYLYPVKKWLR